MSYSYGKTSRERLETCHPLLQELFNRVIKHTDTSIFCGERGEEAQTKAFEEGKSLAQYPESSHNNSPSLAVDAGPYPEGYGSIPAFMALHDIVLRCWSQMKTGDYILVWGGDWDADGDYDDQKLFDPAHWEIRKV